MRRKKGMSTLILLMLQSTTCGKSLNEVLMVLRQLQGTQQNAEVKLLHHTYAYHQRIS
jgi:hypothetical protein